MLLASDAFESTTAHRLLEQHGSLAAVMHASEAVLLDAGLLPADIGRLKLLRLALRRSLRSAVEGRPLLNGHTPLLEYLSFAMGHQPVEEFRVMFTNHVFVLLHDETMWRGTVNHTPVYPREIAKRALEVGAVGIILVHNHPSGNMTPSEADIANTDKIVAACKTIGVVVHDHVIVSPVGQYSFRGNGKLTDA